jgi:hypothetical protein
MGTSAFFEPITQLEQLFRCGEIRPKFFLALPIGQVCHDAHFHRFLMHVQSRAVRVEDFHSNAPVLFFLLIKECSGLDGQKRRFTSRVLLAKMLSPAQHGVVPEPIRISLVVWLTGAICARSRVSEHLLLFYPFSLGVV